MKIKLIICLLIVAPVSLGQHSKPKVSYAKGTLFGYWGYNRSVYANNTIRFVGPGYDFKLVNSKAHDNPEDFNLRVYLNPSQLTIPQFNARVGYYFKNHWAISFGYDHMKYIFADQNEVLLNGTINSGVDNETNWAGTYVNEPVVTNREQFHYENSDGLNYIRFELTRTDLLFKAGRNDWFGISSNLGLSTGGILSFNDFTFAGKKDVRTISLSGYGISAHASLRFEFFRHFFIQSGAGTGFLHQVKVHTRPNDPTSFARHKFGFAEFNTVGGFLIYLKPTNACDSCPIW